MSTLRRSRYRYLIPNGITFLSLSAGVASILFSAQGFLFGAGLLIMSSYILDLLDGELARRLDASSSFGLQLDSLVDIVALGTAPAVFAFTHLDAGDAVPLVFVWPSVLLYVVAGAFRLARFNLLPEKEGQTTSVGLTISTAGATLTLAILSDLSLPGEVAPEEAFLLLLLALAALMASRIPYPSIVWLFSNRLVNVLYLLYLIVTLVVLRLPFWTVWFIFNSGFLFAGLARVALKQASSRAREEAP
ncbi:MAG: CDP-alcohol phosphatidyltransferase family protein [Candidatus Promineifilaceae bacterium]|nr:CDP-alcohol phosphatidyltransferase family protein [Candidatus Promineifilaceae bacterium]